MSVLNRIAIILGFSFIFWIPVSAATSQEMNLLIIDSSFAPLKSSAFTIGSEACYLFHENPAVQVPTQGECFDATQWTSWTENADSSWPTSPEFALAVHGSRSAFLAHQASMGLAKPVLLRSLSAQVGSIPSKINHKDMTKFPRYKNQCSLINWSPAQEAAFRNNSLMDFQDRISSLLTANPTIKVINISLGYKENWVAEDSKNCTPDQVRREFEILQSTWARLIKSFPDRIFVVAAGNEGENFDRADLMARDLWASLVDAENLLLVGAMKSDGRRAYTSNYGLAVEVFALGEEIPAKSPYPGFESGKDFKLGGTSFAAPIVAGQLIARMKKSPKASALEIKYKLVEDLREVQKDLLFKSFEKFCKGKNFLDDCLDVVTEFISRPLLWRPTFEYYLKGRNAWDFKPLALQFQEDLPALGQTKLMVVDNNLIPALLLKPTDNPWELLITIHHEIFHFSHLGQSAEEFFSNDKIKNCVTPYQLALLKDELPAFREELEFYQDSPAWFKKKLSSKKTKSSLFGKTMSYPDFYKKLKFELNNRPGFIFEKYVELGLYPKCILEVMGSSN